VQDLHTHGRLRRLRVTARQAQMLSLQAGQVLFQGTDREDKRIKLSEWILAPFGSDGPLM
jgi:hypothetical protein